MKEKAPVPGRRTKMQRPIPREQVESNELTISKMQSLLKRTATPLHPGKPIRMMALHSYPDDAAKRDHHGVVMTNWLFTVYRENRLTEAERRNLDSGKMTSRMWKQLDELLIQKAAIYGWAIRLSRFVEARYWQWLEEEEDGPELARRFDEAVRHRSLVRRGLVQGDIAEREWAEAKKRGVEELRRLMRLYKAEFNKRHRTATYTEACEWYQKTIDGSPQDFAFWWDNLEALVFAMDWTWKNDAIRANRIALGIEGPAALFDLVAARSENLSESYTRRMISEAAKL